MNLGWPSTLTLLLVTLGGTQALAQQHLELPAQPERLTIRLSPEAGDPEAYIHIVNPHNGKALLSTHRQEFQLTSDDLNLLTRQGQDPLKLSFRLLSSPQKQSEGDYPDYFRESFWRLPSKLQYERTRQIHLEARIVELNDQGVVVSLKPSILQDAYLKAMSRRFKKTQPEVDAAWALLGERKYAGARQAFDVLLKKSSEISPENQERVRFGRGLARFHLEGCQSMEEDFRGVDAAPDFREDVAYFRGLCAVEAQDNPRARLELGKLLEWNSQRYSEPSRFYLGVVAEQEGDLAKAENAYLDTVDFAEDSTLVNLAKDRLSKLEARKARERYAKKIFNGVLTLGSGWDTNAISLPAALRPADYDLQSKATGTWMGVLALEAKNPLFYPLQQKFTYNLVSLNHLNTGISQGNDLQSHNFGASLALSGKGGQQHNYSLLYNMTFLGPWGSSQKYITSPTLKWDWIRPMSPAPEGPLRLLTFNTQLGYLMPVTAATDLANDATALSVGHRSTLRLPSDAFTWGPGAELDLKFAKGSENTSARLGLFAFAERDLGKSGLSLKLTGEAGLAAALYYKSADSRRDYELRTSLGLARLWTSWLETRLQASYNKNLSNLSDRFAYDRLQAGLLLNAFF